MAPFDFAPLTRRYAQDERKRGTPLFDLARWRCVALSANGRGMAPFDFAPLARRYAQDERKRGTETIGNSPPVWLKGK